MRDYDSADRDETVTDRFNRFMKWLSRRPMESWGFFAAGIIIAGILF